MGILSGHRPVLILLASLLIFVTTVVGRTILGSTPLPSGDEASLAAPEAHEMGDPEMIIRLQDRLRLDPEDAEAYGLLGLALLQRVRETADASLYSQAEQAFAEALERDPQQFNALVGQGLLALARHEFRQALHWGEQARTVNPHRVQVYGIIGDAQIELGQYEAAAATMQKMVDTRPELSSYSRVSYIRELYGDVPGAIEAMDRAVNSAGTLASENALWTQVQLGHLYFNKGDLDQAEPIYRRALQARPDYAYALAGLARVQAAQGQYEEAIKLYQKIVERLPMPEFVIALGELYEVTGQASEAKIQYDLVRAMQQLNASAGMNVDLEMALFNADHGAQPSQVAPQARSAYEHRPSIYGADTLAWALYQAGDYEEARRYSQAALRLGTRDAMLYYHAGMIAYALQDVSTARLHLQQALAINPYFSVRYAPQARALLEELGTVLP